MNKKELIQSIKFYIEMHGTTSNYEMDVDTSPCINSIGESIVQLAENFSNDTVSAITYVDGNEYDSEEIPYKDLSIKILREIYNNIKNYYDYVEVESSIIDY